MLRCALRYAPGPPRVARSSNVCALTLTPTPVAQLFGNTACALTLPPGVEQVAVVVPARPLIEVEAEAAQILVRLVVAPLHPVAHVALVGAPHEADVVDVEAGTLHRDVRVEANALAADLAERELRRRSRSATSASGRPRGAIASGRWKLWTLLSCSSLIAAGSPRTLLAGPEALDRVALRQPPVPVDAAGVRLPRQESGRVVEVAVRGGRDEAERRLVRELARARTTE